MPSRIAWGEDAPLQGVPVFRAPILYGKSLQRIKVWQRLRGVRRLLIAQWADFAGEHKGTSYKLHVYVAWTTKDLTGERKDNSLSDLSAGGGSISIPTGAACMLQMTRGGQISTALSSLRLCSCAS